MYNSHGQSYIMTGVESIVSYNGNEAAHNLPHMAIITPFHYYDPQCTGQR